MNPVKNIMQGRLFGHPIHMMLVHFPAALIPISAAVSAVSYFRNDHILALFNFYLVCIGAASGWLAIIFGIIELIKIQDIKEPFKIALMHGGLNTLWVSVLSIIAGVQFKYFPGIHIPSSALVLTQAAVAVFMIYSNYLGGQLVLKYGIAKKE